MVVYRTGDYFKESEMVELTVEQRLEELEKEVNRVKYYTKVECAHCGEPTPLTYAHRFESRNFGRLFNGLFCEKCLGEYSELEDKLREDLLSKFGAWHKSSKKK